MIKFINQPTWLGMWMRVAIVTVPAAIVIGVYGDYWNSYLKWDQSMWALCGVVWTMSWFCWIVRVE